jgi:hypothetical protein
MAPFTLRVSWDLNFVSQALQHFIDAQSTLALVLTSFVKRTLHFHSFKINGLVNIIRYDLYVVSCKIEH